VNHRLESIFSFLCEHPADLAWLLAPHRSRKSLNLRNLQRQYCANFELSTSFIGFGGDRLRRRPFRPTLSPKWF
jgi:hypothetical protein